MAFGQTCQALSRDWCIAIRPTSETTADDYATIGIALTMRKPAFDWDESEDEYRVYVDGRHSVKRVSKAVLHMLAQSGLVDKVATPLPVARWDEARNRFAFGDEHDEELVVPVDEIR